MKGVFSQKEPAKHVSERLPASGEIAVLRAGNLIMVYDFRRKEERKVYLRKNGEEMAPARSLPVAEPVENAVNFPLTATITISKSEWEELILANDRMRSAIERLTHFLEDEAGEEYISRNAVARLLNLDPVALNKKMP